MNEFDKVPIAVVVADLGLQTRTDGGKTFCQCPNHADKVPSALVNNPPHSNVIKCFSCGYSANSLQLIAKVKGISDKEAIYWYNDQYNYGNSAHTNTRHAPAPQPAKPKKNVAELKAAMPKFLDKCSPATAYLATRGLADDDIEAYIAPNSGVNPIFYSLKGRLIIPFRAVDGSLLYLQGRGLTPESIKIGKYLTNNLQNYGLKLTYWGLNKLAPTTHTIIIAEGALTAAAINKAMGNMPQIVAIASPSAMNPIDSITSHLKVAKKIVFWPDNDAGGVGLKGFTKAIDHLVAKGFNNIHLITPAGGDKDAADLLVSHGATAVQRMVASAKPYIGELPPYETQFSITRMGNRVNLNDLELRQLFADAENTDDYPEIGLLLKGVRYNMLTRQFEFLYDDKIEKMDYWVTDMKVAINRLNKAVGNEKLIISAFRNRNFEQSHSFNPFEHLITPNACHPDKHPLNDLLDIFTFSDRHLAFAILDLFLSFVWLNAYRMQFKKFDDEDFSSHIVPAIYGTGGTGKGLLVNILTYIHTKYAYILEFSADGVGKEMAILAAGKLIAHLDDFDPHKKIEMSKVKAYTTKHEFKIRLPYDSGITHIPRTDSIIATSNYGGMHIDETGDRRFFPIELMGSKWINHAEKDELAKNIATYYYNAAATMSGNIGTIEQYDELKRAYNGLLEETRRNKTFEKNQNLPMHYEILTLYFDSLDDYFNNYKMDGDDWQPEHNILVSLRGIGLPKKYCLLQEFERFIDRMHPKLNTQVLTLAQKAFKEIATKRGYISGSSKLLPEHLAWYKQARATGFLSHPMRLWPLLTEPLDKND